jgi:hypothetical protein
MSNELTKEDYDRIGSYYRMVLHPKHPEDVTQQCIEMMTGPFKGVVYKYGKFQVSPPDTEDESTAKYEYDIIMVPPELEGVEHTDEEGEEFEFMIGEILVKMIWDRYQEAEKSETTNPVTFVEDNESEDRAPNTITFDTQ